jgi:hypothetical protein
MVRQMELLRAAARRYESGKDKKSLTDQEILSKEASARILTRLRQAESHSADHE